MLKICVFEKIKSTELLIEAKKSESVAKFPVGHDAKTCLILFKVDTKIFPYILVLRPPTCLSVYPTKQKKQQKGKSMFVQKLSN